MRMPRPPPPALAFTMTGYPICSATTRASSTVSTRPSLPGMRGTPASSMVALAWALLPILRMISALGPMKVMPQARQTSTKWAFSLRKP